MNTSLGSNKRGGASADSSAITRMRKLAAIAGNYNQPSKQQRFPAGVVSVGLANSALQVFQNATGGVAASTSGPSFSIVPIGLGNTTQTLNVFYVVRIMSPATFPSFSEGCFAVYSFTVPSTGDYTFTITPAAAVGQQVAIFATYSPITSDNDLYLLANGLNPFNAAEPIANDGGAIPNNRTFVGFTAGLTVYLAAYSINGNDLSFTPQTYTLNIVKV